MDSELAECLRFARMVIEAAVRGREVGDVPAPRVARDFGGVFVTLRQGRRLRGCMGTLDTSQPLVDAIRSVAVDAALHDPRFLPLAPSDLSLVRVEISVLSRPAPADDPLSFEPGRHGVLIRCGAKRGLFLPEVAVEHGLTREAFLSRCCTEKAGVSADAWRRPDCQVSFFTTEKVGEPEP